MKKATEILSEEHKHILRLIKLMCRECEKLENGEEIDKNFFHETILFIKEYVEKFHASKEEDILFAEFNKNSDKTYCNPVEQMLHEHEQGRNLVTDMEKGLKNKNKAKVIESARTYAELLHNHMYKEDNILYPMINEVISTETQEVILNKFWQIEKEKFGIKTQEEFLNIIKKLETKLHSDPDGHQF